MSKEREALKLALEALSSGEKMKADGIGWWEYDSRLVKQAITAAKEALAQPAQEPVAWMYQCTADNSTVVLRRRTNWAESGTGLWIETPLYTTPPQRPWVGLTDEEIHDTEGYVETRETYRLCRAIEAKLKEKNFD